MDLLSWVVTNSLNSLLIEEENILSFFLPSLQLQDLDLSGFLSRPPLPALPFKYFEILMFEIF